jgi:hypothetical protein
MASMISATLEGFTPSTVPGCRVPHLWLPDGRSLYDALGPGYTLLRRARSVEVDRLVAAAARRGVPLAVLDLDEDSAATLYSRRLLLARPDQHVAWRGDEVPTDPLALVDLIRGASTLTGRPNGPTASASSGR